MPFAMAKRAAVIADRSLAHPSPAQDVGNPVDANGSSSTSDDGDDTRFRWFEEALKAVKDSPTVSPVQPPPDPGASVEVSTSQQPEQKPEQEPAQQVPSEPQTVRRELSDELEAQ